MSDFSATLGYLYGLQTRGMKFGLENTRALLLTLGNPHERLATVHIAGTNGKGSTAAMIAAILSAAGYRTGLYTSPHLVRFTERIRVDGAEIDEAVVADYVRFLRKQVERLHATFFEVTTALALRYFSDEKVEIAVIEAGLGGRLDSTNVLSPILTMITSIALDHTDLLGDSLSDIAMEKGGIVKRHVPCFVGRAGRRELSILRRIARVRRATIFAGSSGPRVSLVARALNGQVVEVRTRSVAMRNLFCSLAGDHQIENIALAVRAVEGLRRHGFVRVGEREIRRGLADVRGFSGLRGRLELIMQQPTVFLDVAHNPDAMRALSRSLASLVCGRVVGVFGVMKDKDVEGMAQALARTCRLTVAVSPSIERAMDDQKIVEVFHRAGGKCIRGGSVGQGVRLALREARDGEAVVVTGSHYVVGEFLKEIESDT